MKRLFLIEDAEIEEEIKKLIEIRAKKNGINDLEVVLTTAPLSLTNLPMNCDVYVFHLGLIDESYLKKIKEKNPNALIYGTGADEFTTRKFRNLLDGNRFIVDEIYIEIILKNIIDKNEKVGR